MDTIKIDKTKKTHTGCDHPNSLHEEGLCWKSHKPRTGGFANQQKILPLFREQNSNTNTSKSGIYGSGSTRSDGYKEM